jgi:hypothetical protein
VSEQPTPSIHARTGLVLITAFSALSFGWAALVLPWRAGAPLALVAGGLSILHAFTAATALFLPAAVLRTWRVLALCSVGAASVFVSAISLTSIEVVRTYGALGWGLTALLAVIGWLLLVATLPIALWGLRMTGGAYERR